MSISFSVWSDLGLTDKIRDFPDERFILETKDLFGLEDWIEDGVFDTTELFLGVDKSVIS